MPARLVRVAALAAKEIVHIRRDPRTLYMALAMPVLLLILFGYGVSFDMDRIPLALLDHDRTPASRDVRASFFRPDDFRLVEEIGSPDEIEALFRSGAAVGVLVVPRGFSETLARGGTAELQLVLDASDANTASQTSGKAEAIARTVGAEAATRAGFETSAPIELRAWTRFNPSGDSALFLVPGLTAYLLAIVAVLLTALTVAREWEQGSMEQLFATPIGRLELVVGKLLPYLGLGVVAVLLVLAVGAWVFGVPIRGSLAFLAGSSLLFLVGALGQGLLISVVTRNQMVATQAGALSAMLPAMLLSGVIYPIENMPRVLQWISVVIPARYYVESLRGVLLRGNGAATLWPQAAALAVFAAVMVGLSALAFRRRVA